MPASTSLVQMTSCLLSGALLVLLAPLPAEQATMGGPWGWGWAQCAQSLDFYNLSDDCGGRDEVNRE